MEIDPLETIVAWLKANLTTAQQRVATKHRYGVDWAEDVNGVSVHADGGPVDQYAEISVQRLEIRMYGTGTLAVMSLWRELKGLARTNERFTVETSLGTALVHTFAPESELSLLYDETLKKDVGVVFFTAIIAEEAVA